MRSLINNGVMFRVKLRRRKYSLQRKRLTDTAFLRQVQPVGTLAFSGRYGYFNRANISARISDTPSSLHVCTDVFGLVYNADCGPNPKVKKCSYGLLTEH